MPPATQFDCKVCRNNFAEILDHFGAPEGSIRADYARWLWRAHNNANEHSYATHSPNLQQAEAMNLKDPWTKLRNPDWSSPPYFHPWYMSFEDAKSVWTNLAGLESV